MDPVRLLLISTTAVLSLNAAMSGISILTSTKSSRVSYTPQRLLSQG